MIFENNIKGGNVPKEFIPSVEKGFKMAMANGPLAGFEMDSMKITLYDGSFHAVDSDQLSFDSDTTLTETSIITETSIFDGRSLLLISSEWYLVAVNLFGIFFNYYANLDKTNFILKSY